MPSNRVHRAISKKRTKKTYKELHQWIDDNKDDKSVNHRSKNHYYSEELKNFVFINFGGNEAVSEWLFHIALDNLDTSVINDWNYLNIKNNFHKFGFEPDGFIHHDDYELNDSEMEEEFSEDFEEEDYF
jgi:hypothetical protein